MHARTFLCREGLWQQFEEIAREQGAPIDEVLSEAMRSYARQRSYGTDEPNGPAAHDYGAADNIPDLARTNAMRQAPPPRNVGATMPNPARMPPVPAAPPSRASGLGMPLPPPPPGGRGQARMPATAQMPAPPPRRGGPIAAPPPPAPPQSMRRPPSQQPSYAQTDPDPQPWQNAQQQPQAPPPQRARGPARLSLTYGGRHVEVTKERFVLGRSKSQADLVLEDPNVSRQHAAIELQGNEWMLVDLGSTNGCYVDGQRVTTRPIQDGDLIEITTHQVSCTLR